jgi:uncharacterized protein (TIGR03083 family)
VSSADARPRTLLDKSEVLAGLFDSWDALDALLTGLPDEAWHVPTPLPGWCVYDVVAHIVGTESMLLGVPTPEPDTDVSTLSHVRNGIGVLNECWVRDLRGGAGADLLDRFRAVTNDRRKLLVDMSEADWDAVTPTPAGPDSYGRFMRVRIFDCWMHEQDIREGLRRPPAENELLGPTARLALDEIVTSLGFVVGKLGGAPDASQVRFELTGPLARIVNVAVDGRGRVVDDFGPAGAASVPTVTIRLDGLLFTRLAGGRTSADRHIGAVEYRGDEGVGRRIVEHLNFVI